MARLGRVPSVGDAIEWAGFRLEVLDMDGKRVDRILVHPGDSGDVASASDGRDERDGGPNRADVVRP